MPRPRSRNDERSWLAFQYVNGELSPEDAAAFEHRLSHDLAACETVAAMVELSRAIALVSPSVASSFSPRPRRAWRLRVGATALAATLLVAVSLGLPWPSASVSPTQSPRSGVEPAGTIALTWWDLRGEEPDRALWPGLDPVLDRAVPGSRAALSDPQDDEDQEEAPLPSWLLATLEESGSDDDSAVEGTQGN